MIWGFAFWTATPEVFSLLADRSIYPSDRVGDAQAVMSFGRVVGPTVGGILVASGSFALVGTVSLIALIGAGLTIETVATRPRWRAATTDN